MALNRGKQFEQNFKENFLKSIPFSTIDRLYDSVSGKKAVKNISDFIGYKEPNIYYLECKSTKENTFNFHKLTQYDKLITKVGIPGVRVGVVIWFINHDRILYVPIKTIKTMKKDNKKSVNITTFDTEGYRYVEIPSTKKRVFMESDYSVLTKLNNGD